jgi:ABC-type lipoprotein export system ATPase subunit
MVRLPGRPQPLFAIAALKVPAGSRILIRGPSGTGKTTLLHLLAGQFPPDEGEILLGGRDFSALGGDDRRRLRRDHFGIIFQRMNLIGHLDAAENVGLAFAPGSPSVAAKALEALRRMGLEGALRRRCATLSPGEQQRVAVARVLARSPDIVLADEPTSSLDGRNAEAVMEALCEASAGKTLVVVSHDGRIDRFFEDARDFEKLVRP